MKATDIYQRVTDQLVTAIESADGGAWRAPWHGVTRLPANATTGVTYRGGNTLVLWASQITNGYTSNQWATYKQWAAAGAQVRRGEKSTFLVRWVEPSGKRDGDKRTPYLVPVGFSVFNVAQVDGWVAPEPEFDPATPVEHAEEFFAGVGAAVLTHDEGRAYYQRLSDTIHVPGIEHFAEAEAYYAVLAHEHIHWTGAEARLDRTKGATFGDRDYAYEELIAEIGAAFVGAHLGLEVEPREDHAQYLASWLAKFRTDPKALFNAAQAAQKATDYLVAAATSVEPELEEAHA